MFVVGVCRCVFFFFFFFKQKTAYEIYQCDWSSDVCSSDLMKIGTVLTWRQIIPVFFVSSLILSGILAPFLKSFFILFLIILFSYLFANAGFSLSIALKKGLKYLFILPIVLTTLHLSYGFGYLKGILDFIVLKKQKRKKIKNVPLTR